MTAAQKKRAKKKAKKDKEGDGGELQAAEAG